MEYIEYIEYKFVRRIGLPFLLPYDVHQYCTVENSMLLFKTHTKQLRADLSQHFGPGIGPSSGFTSVRDI